MKEQRELTYGEKLVGIKFNPSNQSEVDEIKKLMAQAIDILNKEYDYRESKGEEQSYVSSHGIFNAAIADLLRAQMMAVKYLTNRY